MATCLVSGSISTILGTAVTDAVISVSVTIPFFLADGSLVSGQIATTTTDTAGDFSIAVVRTTTLGKQVTFEIDYNVGNGQRRSKKYFVYIPEAATANFSDLVTQSNVPAVTTTFPASNVTVSAIPNLSASTAQDAFAELQADIDSISGTGISSLTGDVTAAGPGAAAATIAAIQGKTVSGTTGTGNVVFSAAPTLTGDVSATGKLGVGQAAGTDTLEVSGAVKFGNSAIGSTRGKIYTTSASGLVVVGQIGSSNDFVLASTAGDRAISMPTGTSNLYLGQDGGLVGVGMVPVRTLDVTGTLGATGAAVLGSTLSVAGQLTSTVSTGTAPLVIASTTKVNNLHVARATLADTVTTVTTNANLTGPITSVGNATSIASQTGTGSTFAMSAGPTFTGTLAAASATLSGTLIFNGSGAALQMQPTTGTASAFAQFFNTGGQSSIGAESSAGGVIATGTTAYAMVIAPAASRVLQLAYNGGAGVALTLSTAGALNLPLLTASTALALDASKNIVSVTNTGTGSNVLSVSPTFTGTLAAADGTYSGTLGVTGNATFSGVLKVSRNTGAPFITYRPDSTLTTAVAHNFSLNNASAAEVTYGSLQVDVVANTAGAHTGTFKVYPYLAGTQTLAMTVAGAGVTIPGAITVGSTVIHTLSATPASAAAAGTVGTISWDSGYIYVCTATNTWKRTQLLTW